MSADPHTPDSTMPREVTPVEAEPATGSTDPQSLIDRVLREVSDLTGQVAESAVEATQSGEIDSNSADGFDLAALEREIENLLQSPTQTNTETKLASGGTSDLGSREEVGSTPETDAQALPTSGSDPSNSAGSDGDGSDDFEALAEVLDPAQRRSDPTPAASAFEAEPIDPVQREIEAALADDTAALLDACGGDLDAALGSVFDPRVLAGQEEEINRALIEAFGSSRMPWRSGEPAVVTNPAPGFTDGPSREMPPGTPRVELDRQTAADSTPATPTTPGASPSTAADRPMPPRTFEEIGAASIARDQAPEYAGETPFEPAFPAVPIVPADAGAAAPVETPAGPATPVAEAPSRTDDAPATPASSERPRPRRRLRIGPAIRRTVEWPLVAAAAPMRALPDSARAYTGIVAATLLLMVPLAWWLAHAKAGARGVGPVTFTGAVAAGDGGAPGSE